jgi:pentapeptide repeat protein/WD40 domain-containing protein
VFTRTLWRATEDTWRSRPADRKPARPSKLLLSCRTHYFRTIRQETTHFAGQHRDGPAPVDYLALLTLPFDEEQVRAYLAANLPDADVNRLLDLIGSVHNLREIAEQLETVERAKLAGRTVRAVDLYGSLVSQWLERDDGKHCLLPEHKELLMEHLAAELWRSGRTAWGVGDVEQWLLEFLNARPDLELHSPARVPDLWKEDLRTATFLVRRDDDTFCFAHTSLREYFLARYLGRALELPPEQVRQRWQLPVPSPETLDFLGQWLAGHDTAGRARGTAALAAHIPAGRTDAAAVLAFAYSLAAARGDHPSHDPAGSHLAGADLTGWWIDSGNRQLDLRGLSLTGADLTDAVLRDVDLSGADLDGADLTRTEVHDSDLSSANLRRANLTGTVFRHCNLTGARWTGSTAYQTQALRCRPAQDRRRQGWLVAPAGAARPSAALMSAFTGHTHWVTGGGWSPDGTRLRTTSRDNTARIWDAATGQPHLTLSGHTNRVASGAWSPDGTRLRTTSGDNTARIWDATTAQPHLTLTGHTNRVASGAWSPDGTRLLTTSRDNTARIWDATTGQLVGWQLGQLPDSELAVWSSPEHELLGASEGAWRWLGWLVPQDGRLVRLPAETWGTLPPLDPPAATPL